MTIEITYWAKLTRPVGQRVRTTWPALVARLSVPRVEANKRNIPGFSFATFAGEQRALVNVERVHAIGLDFDKGVKSLVDLFARFGGAASFVHSTWQHTNEAPRARAFLLLSRPVTGAEYRRIYGHVAGVCEDGGQLVDRSASDPSRLWFLPATPPGGAFMSCEGKGPAIDVDSVLASLPPPPEPTPFVPSSGPTGDVEVRAEKYLERCSPAISGSGGSTLTFTICQKLTRGFGLSEETAFRLLAGWNSTCSPPWSERDLRRKIHEAATRGSMPEGALRDAQRSR